MKFSFDPAKAYSPVTPGEYEVTVESLKEGKGEKGAYVSFMLGIADGQAFAGRKVFLTASLENEVGVSILTGFIAAVTGIDVAAEVDLNSLVGKKAVAVVGLKDGKNVVRYCKKA